jgi:FMN-dependent NADH-azoreductase
VRLFRLDSSVQGVASVTREIADCFEQAWLADGPESTVTRRDLMTTPLSPLLWTHAVSASETSAAEHTPEQRSATDSASELASEVLAAEVVLIGAPLYNWGPSPHIVCWIDMLWTDPRFAPRTYPLRGKPIVIIAARGGDASPDGPRAGWDHSVPYLVQTFGPNVFGGEVILIDTELTLAEQSPHLASQREKAVELRARSRAIATETGTALARNARR